MIRVYRYGVASPHDGADLVYAQMRGAHAYRNTLIEIERGRRGALRDLESAEVRGLTAEVAAADEACQAIGSTIKVARAESRKRSERKVDLERLAEARSVKRAITGRLYEARRNHMLATRSAVDIVNELAKCLLKSAREHCGVYWGTYLLAEEAMGASSSAPLFGKDGITQNDPKFIRWTGDGAVRVQIQKGASVAAVRADAEHSQLQIREPTGAWSHPTRSERRRLAKRGEVRIRVGSEPNGKPVWAAWRLDMHRPLPEEARIKEATIHVRQRGAHSEWSLLVTVDVPPAAVVPSESRGEAVGVDVGWRLIDGCIRVAVCMGAGGAVTELRLDAPTIRLLRSSEALRSKRDERFNAAKARIRKAAAEPVAPEWLRESGKTMHAWRSPQRLAQLHARWAEERFSGDDMEFGRLEAWWWTDRHLWSTEAQASLQGHRRRKDIYRVFAAKLAARYDVIVLEKFDLRKVARTEETGEETPAGDNDTSRSNRQLASVSEFRACLLDAARSRGRSVVMVDASETTRTCHVCGLVEAFDAAAHLRRTCACGSEWDQDENAAEVILARWRERPGDAKILVPARSTEIYCETMELLETRWQRVARLRKEKLARMDTARKSASNAAE